MTFQNLSSTLWRISRCFHHMLSCSQTCHRGCSTHIRGYGWSVLHVTYTSETTWATYALKHSHRHQRPEVETPLTHTHFRDHERWTGYLSHTYTHFRDQSEKLSSFHTHTDTHTFKCTAFTSETMTGHLKTLSQTLTAYSRNNKWNPDKPRSWYTC